MSILFIITSPLNSQSVTSPVTSISSFGLSILDGPETLNERTVFLLLMDFLLKPIIIHETYTLSTYTRSLTDPGLPFTYIMKSTLRFFH